MKKQAYGLRFILEAPELEISPEERVSLPNGVEAADGQYSCAPVFAPAALLCSAFSPHHPHGVWLL